MDLILMDGCINDVSLDMILDPETDQEELVELTHKFCDQEMTVLIQKVRSLAPQAYVVVAGYYQIVSQESDFGSLSQWSDSTLTQEDQELDDSANAVTANSIAFRDHSSTSLTAAVEAVNGSQATQPMIAFAEPQFGPANAVFAPDSWLWKLTTGNESTTEQDVDLQLIPEDPLLEFRLSACLEANSFADYVGCVYLSVGHPNPQGARVYADAVIQSLTDLGVLPGDNNAQ